MSAPKLGLRARVLLAASLSAIGAAGIAALAVDVTPSAPARILVTLALALLLWLVIARAVLGAALAELRALAEGLSRLAEGDFSVRVRAGRRDELGALIDRFNHLGATLRDQRDDGYQRQLLLETVLEAAPMVILIASEAGRILHANAAARAFFASSPALGGGTLDELFAAAPAELRGALDAASDALITTERDGEPEALHVARRAFRINTQLHTLILIRSLTREVARQDAQTYKNAIRLISHELNNSLAPIASLLHSGRRMLDRPEHAPRLATVLDVIEERSQHLQRFLEGYAALARLPAPAPRAVAWIPFLEPIRALYPFELTAVPDEAGYFDPAQIQQLLINLLKNAVEAGSPLPAIEVAVARGEGGEAAIRVADRGAGIDEEALRRALLPFYSTKEAGGGVGLALCREIATAHGGALSVRRREGGGVEVECRLPGPPAGYLVRRSI